MEGPVIEMTARCSSQKHTFLICCLPYIAANITQSTPIALVTTNDIKLQPKMRRVIVDSRR